MAKALMYISFALNAPEFKPRNFTLEATWTTVWIGVGSGDGRGDGTIVGTGEGAAVVGDGVGTSVGWDVGTAVVGDGVGTSVGCGLGAAVVGAAVVGPGVGSSDGASVGSAVGAAEGRAVGAQPPGPCRTPQDVALQGVPSNAYFSRTCVSKHQPRYWSKAAASLNICFMFVSASSDQFPSGWLKDVARRNI